jgi:membrane protein YqaA with SNARE-associated domain
MTFQVLWNVRVWLLVVGVSALATAVTLTYYYLGQQGTEAVLKRFPRLKADQWERVQGLYERYGPALLFFSFIPGIGLLMETAAGAFGIRRIPYLLWVFLGRIARNWILALIFGKLLLEWLAWGDHRVALTDKGQERESH